MIAVVLFTRDLRVHDQPALHAAAQTHEKLVPLFVFDDVLLARSGPNRLTFLLHSLEDLRRSLRARGADLVVRSGDPVAETVRVARSVGATAIFTADDASPYAQRRQLRLADACRTERLELRLVNTTAVVPSKELAPAGRDHYRVFTPYWRRWRDAPTAAVLPAPPRVLLPDGVETDELPSLHKLSPRPASPRVWNGGEREGRKRLERWLTGGLAAYAEGGDELASERTSRLSAYLHFGCVSANEVVARARAQNPTADPFVRQLCWRDFYAQLLAANPTTPSEDLYPRHREPIDDERAFVHWRNGRTGFPIVDAAMRHLHGEGWLSNRARLIVAAFLTRTLGLDWRRGAAVFMDLLVDGDVANNVGNWQWVAGTGVDTRPNRRFNPTAQAKRFDPSGDYVRRYVPELSELVGSSVHEPWRAPPALVAPEYRRPLLEQSQPRAPRPVRDEGAVRPERAAC